MTEKVFEYYADALAFCQQARMVAHILGQRHDPATIYQATEYHLFQNSRLKITDHQAWLTIYVRNPGGAGWLEVFYITPAYHRANPRYQSIWVAQVQQLAFLAHDYLWIRRRDGKPAV